MQNSPARFLLVSILAPLMAGAIGGAFILRWSPAWLVPTPQMGGVVARGEKNENATSTVGVAEEDRATTAVVKNASPAVVSIIIMKELTSRERSANDPYDSLFDDPFFAPFRVPTQTPMPSEPTKKEKVRVGGGSGFLVTSDGMIVTNRHVVSDESAEYTVLLQDGRKFPAKVLARDLVLDLAVVKIDGKDLPQLEFGDSDKIEVGQTVIAIGYALAEFRNTVTKGVISGVNRRLVAGGSSDGSEVIEEAIQTDAAINPGNSGGPLLDLNGRVIGMNTAVSENAQSLGFALPVNALRRAVESVQKTGRIVRPWLGVRYTQIDEEYAKQNSLAYEYGALIVRGDARDDVAVIPGSPADKAGLVENDIVLAINGQKLDDGHSLSGLLGKYNPGEKLTLKIARKEEEKEISVTLEERKE